MLFSQVASFALFFLGVGSVVASPTPDESAIVARQDESSITSILTTLQGQNNNTLAQISRSLSIALPLSLKMFELANLVNAGNANDATITPLITELTTSITGATTSLGALSPSRRHLKRDIVADVAVLLATIIAVSDRRIWSMSTNICKGYSDHIRENGVFQVEPD